MTTALQIEILDLRHFSARQLRPLLEQEARVWEKRLRWDYSSSTELLLQYLDSRILPGFVALVGGRVSGFTFCVYEGAKAVIGDVYVAQEIAPSLGLPQLLARHMLDVLEASPDVDRIESQLLLFDAGALTQPFETSGFTIFPRLFEECPLSAANHPPAPLPANLAFTRWSASSYQPAAELIHASYTGHIDAEINDQYRTLHGSLRFLHNIVRFPGCGIFDGNSSWIVRERQTNTMIGIVLCSRVAGDTAHVTQLCIAPAYRGKGLGRILMLQCMKQLPGEGYRAITLTVTEANRSAVRLYRGLGFVTRHRFDAMVLDKPAVSYRLGERSETGIKAGAPTVSAASTPTTESGT